MPAALPEKVLALCKHGPSRRSRAFLSDATIKAKALVSGPMQSQEAHGAGSGSSSRSRDGGSDLERTTLDTPDLISGLPDDLAIACLIRVPAMFHHMLKKVSKPWRACVSSAAFLDRRGQLGLRDHWLLVLAQKRTKRDRGYAIKLQP